MLVELDRLQREIILAHLKNSPAPYCDAPAKYEVEKIRKKLENHT